MKTEDILAYEAEVRAMREALATYIVVFEFEESGRGEALGDGRQVAPDYSLTGSGDAGPHAASDRP